MKEENEMTTSLNLNFAYFDAAFDTKDFEVLRISPQGKQKFNKFAVAVTKQLWAMNPISPAALENEIQRLVLAAIKQQAIKAKSAGETSLQVSYNLVDILQSILPESAKLTKEELEAWLRANASNFKLFLVSRGHSEDVTLVGKANKLVELLGKAASPNPGWKPINLELILALVSFLALPLVEGSEAEEAKDKAPETTSKLLAKVEALLESPTNDVDAL